MVRYAYRCTGCRTHGDCMAVVDVKADMRKYCPRLPRRELDYELFAERAAILEYDAGYTPEEAAEQVIHELWMADADKYLNLHKKN